MIELNPSIIPNDLKKYFAPKRKYNPWILRNDLIWHKPNCTPECISKDTRIFIKTELRFIKQIKIGDLINQEYSKIKILSPSGWVKIKNVWTKKVKKATFNTGFVDTIICSPEHRFLVVKDYHKNRKIKKDIESVKDFKTAETLINSSHRVVYADISKWFASKNNNLDITTIKNVEWVADFTYLDNKSFKEIIKKTPLQLAKECNDSTLRKYTYKHTWVYASNTHNEYTRRVIRADRLKGLDINFDKVRALNSPKTENRYFTLDYDLGWLIGLYCAEGGFNQPRGFQGKITLGKNEQEKASKFVNILKNKFNIEATVHIEKNYIVIQYSSATFYAIATYIVDGICSQKALNIDYLINTPHEFRKGLWDGYIDGDGHKQDDSTWSSRSASEALIEGLQTIGTTLGKIMSIERNRKTIDKRTHKKYTASNIWTNGNHEYDIEGNAYVRIKNLKISNEEEEFVDIEVEGGLFIIENGLISHNSSSDRFTNDFEHIFFFVKNNDTLYWTNERTLKLVTRAPRTSIEGIDWEWQPCKKCGGSGFSAVAEEVDRQQRSLESFFEGNGAGAEEEQKTACKKCSGTGKVKYSLWTGHDYYFQQQFEPYKLNRWGGKYKTNENVKTSPQEKQCGGQGSLNRMGYDCYPNPFGRNLRSVWTIKVASFKGSHFAVYPEELCIRPILAGSPEFVCKSCGMPRVKILKPTGNYIVYGGYGSKTAEHLGVSPTSSILTKSVQEKAMAGYSDCGCSAAGYEPGIVIDPFMGSGTTALVALKLGRRFIGIDSNPEYVKMAYGRIKPFLEQKKVAEVFV
ncbi:MAG: DNA methyltransferase [Nitrospirota bacterium]|nr:DNA methyltransferase [Nitrospirota bacterium]